MSIKKIGTKGKPIRSQGREVINNVITFMQHEAEEGLQIPLKNYRQRVMIATGIGKNTYHKITKVGRYVNANLASTFFSSPHKNRQRKSSIRDKMTPGHIEQIRTIIHNFYILEKRRPTLSGILQKIQDSEVDFEGDKTTLNRLLKSMGFRWKKTSDNRKALMEKYDIRLKRIEYLKKMLQYRVDGRTIVYTGETYIHLSHAQSDDEKELKNPVSKGQRLIIVHAGGEGGFVDNGLLIFKSGSKSGDYHDDMNHNNFMHWVATQLIPNLPERSVLVVDNTSCHNVTVTKNVTSGSLKLEMSNWLTERGIHFEEKSTKPELYKLIQANKSRFPLECRLDLLMEQHGHNVLRLPPYHPDLNPLEKIWALVKNWVAARNVTFTLSDVEQLTRQKIEEVGVDEWKKNCDHVLEYEKILIEKEHLLDKTLDEFCCTVNTGSSEEESESEEDSDFGVAIPISDSE